MKKWIVLGIFLVIASTSSEQDSAALAKDKNKTDTLDLASQYGYKPAYPIKVGGGPSEQRAYLQRLRDAQGKPVSFERVQSCCAYKTDSPNAFDGVGLLDVYEITYRDQKNKKKKVKVYITFYDLDVLKPLSGFTLTD
jgi:hypothetical protein